MARCKQAIKALGGALLLKKVDILTLERQAVGRDVTEWVGENFPCCITFCGVDLLHDVGCMILRCVVDEQKVLPAVEAKTHQLVDRLWVATGDLVDVTRDIIVSCLTKLAQDSKEVA